MNYRHGYHAGNFADVFKHLVLIDLINALKRKENSFCYLDTHAGRGVYSLSFSAKEKNQESLTGIQKIMKNTEKDLRAVSETLKIYHDIVKQYHYPDFYPGSPAIATSLLREQDRSIFCDVQMQEYKNLKMNFQHENNAAIHLEDGYRALKAFLPPKEKRGLILIDPPFESDEEWDKILEGLKIGLARFPSGVFAVWYPTKYPKIAQRFLKSVDSVTSHLNSLVVELSIYPQDAGLSLSGSGMLIINPPWQLEKNIQQWLPWLWKQLSYQGAGTIAVRGSTGR